jgi:hypothetical protein
MRAQPPLRERPKGVGADGRWPDDQALFAWVRQHHVPPTPLQTARHEAGHVVVAHALGIEVKRAAAGLSEQRDRLTTRLGVTVESGELRSRESSLLGSVAGRIEDERQGVYTIFMIKPGEDEWTTLTYAHALSHGDPQETARLLADTWVRTKGILDVRRAAVANIAAALLERDLNAVDIASILGPLPPLTFQPGMWSEEPDTATRFDEAFIHGCISTMMKARPFAVALIHVTPPMWAWFSTDGLLMRQTVAAAR